VSWHDPDRIKSTLKRRSVDRETKVVLLWIFIGLFLVGFYWYLKVHGLA